MNFLALHKEARVQYPEQNTALGLQQCFRIFASMKPLIIGITGGSGSGKTTFIRELKASFTKQEVCIISQDDYYLPREQQLRDPRGVINFDLPTSIDKKGFVKDLKKLVNGRAYTRQEYTFNNELKNPRLLEFKPAPVVIVEGLFVFHYKKVRKRLDLKVFISAKENLKVIRRIKRDQLERNYPLEDVLYRYEHHVLPAFEQFIQPYVSEADIVVNNNSVFEKGLQVVKGFVRNYLDELQRDSGMRYRFREEE